MRANLSDDLRRDRRTALRSYSASLMSNTKWRAVLSVLRNDNLGIRQITAKLVDVDEPKSMSLPWLDAPHAFVDSMAFGPFPLIAIEWIEVPAIAILPRRGKLPAEEYFQDTVAVRSALLALGKRLPLENTTTGLRIVGLVR